MVWVRGDPGVEKSMWLASSLCPWLVFCPLLLLTILSGPLGWKKESMVLGSQQSVEDEPPIMRDWGVRYKKHRQKNHHPYHRTADDMPHL